MAVVLASVGVYGVMAYLVARRTREIGIRIAIGARPEQVNRQVLIETAWLAAVAVCAGLAGAWALTRYLENPAARCDRARRRDLRRRGSVVSGDRDCRQRGARALCRPRRPHGGPARRVTRTIFRRATMLELT